MCFYMYIIHIHFHTIGCVCFVYIVGKSCCLGKTVIFFFCLGCFIFYVTEYIQLLFLLIGCCARKISNTKIELRENFCARVFILVYCLLYIFCHEIWVKVLLFLFDRQWPQFSKYVSYRDGSLRFFSSYHI